MWDLHLLYIMCVPLVSTRLVVRATVAVLMLYGRKPPIFRHDHQQNKPKSAIAFLCHSLTISSLFLPVFPSIFQYLIVNVGHVGYTLYDLRSFPGVQYRTIQDYTGQYRTIQHITIQYARIAVNKQQKLYCFNLGRRHRSHQASLFLAFVPRI
jgi:hypothetical protein